MLNLTNQDRDKLTPLLAPLGVDMPTIKLSIYKNRRGRYKGIYLWCQADLGTCRVRPVFASTWNYEPIPIEDTQIKIIEEGAF